MTSGDTKEALDGLKKMFYDPDAFGILPYKHNYTQTGEYILTGYFVPCTKVPKDRKRFLDQRGFVDEDKVKEWQNEVRATMVNTPEALMDHCAEYPFNDTEAFSSGVINKFNKLYITEQLTKIRALKTAPKIDTGFLEYTYKNNEHAELNINGFKWIPNKGSNLQILEHPLWHLPEVKEGDKVIWTPPTEPIRNLYVIGIDGIDIGGSLTSELTKSPSDFALVVFKRAYGLLTPKVVAVYKDRPNDIREAYKTALKLALYYNALINIEATRMSLVSWARQIKLTKWFMKRPRATLNESLRNTNKQFGTPAVLSIIDHLNDLIADFINDYYEDIWFDELLDLLNNYSIENKRRFDLVVALGMAMLADEELLGIVPKIVETRTDNWLNIGYYTDEQGRRRYGIIPNLNILINVNNNFGLLYDNVGIRTSDPRLYTRYI